MSSQEFALRGAGVRHVAKTKKKKTKNKNRVQGASRLDPDRVWAHRVETRLWLFPQEYLPRSDGSAVAPDGAVETPRRTDTRPRGRLPVALRPPCRDGAAQGR